MSFLWGGGAGIDTPVLDYWWHLLWVSKPECQLIRIVEVNAMYVPRDPPLVPHQLTSLTVRWQTAQFLTGASNILGQDMNPVDAQQC